MRNTSPEIEPDCFYHIYNRANGSERMFLSDENYRFFLRKYIEHLNPIVNTYCYCLMPNHFHLLVQIKSEAELVEFFSARKSKALPTLEELCKLKQKTLSLLVSKQFANFFSSYTQAFNKQQNRMGSLFMKNFKRIKITDEKYFKKVVHYIHYNPVDAKLMSDPARWEFSSFSTVLSTNETFLKRDELIEWFHDLENFKVVHQYESNGGELIDL